MALLGWLSGVDESARDWVSSVNSELRGQPDRYAGYVDHYAFDLGVDPELVTGIRTTPPLGVHAVGLMAQDDDWRPTLLVMEQLAPGSSPAQPTSADEFPALADLLRSVGSIPPVDVSVVGIKPPVDQYESIQGDMRGTVGLPVQLSDGSPGVLTAGHVARKKDTSVELGCGISGRVAFSDHRYNHKDGAACADVAAIRLEPNWRSRARVPSDLRMGEIRHLRTLSPINLSGTGEGGRVVRFAGPEFFVAEDEGAWGDFIFVDPISVSGDSGSLAIAQNGLIAGQVVGGATDYSIVQAIDYLVNATGATPNVELVD